MGKRTRKRATADSGVVRRAPESSPPSDLSYTRPWLPWAGVLVMIAGAALAYLPVWKAGYVWDDDDHLTANPCIVGPLGFTDIWTTDKADISPLTRSTFWLEHALWGLAPAPYHVVNVLLHAACAITLWRVLRRLRMPGAWLGAALWEFHPVEAESVAWISEMKNTESGLFFLLSVFFYLDWLKSKISGPPVRRGWAYGLTLFFAALAMACKSSTVVLPAVLFLISWWVEGKWPWRRLLSLMPVFLMTAASSALSIGTQHHALALDASYHWGRTWPERVAAAGDAVWFYLGKLAWPHPLIAVYPRWQIETANALSYVPLLAVFFALGLFWVFRNGWARPWFVGFAYFLVALLPALGLIDGTIFRYSIVFDHFQYLASMGPLVLAGAGLVWLADRFLPGKVVVQSLMAAALLFVLGFASYQRSLAYRSDETLWTDTVAKNPACWVAYYNLANDSAGEGKTDEAIQDFQGALNLYPGFPEAHNNLANLLWKTGHATDAVDQYRSALKFNPSYADAHFNLGNALAQGGHADDAIDEYRAALDLNPELLGARDALGNAFAQRGQLDQAIEQFHALLALAPRSTDGHVSLGNALFMKGEVDDAIAQYREALTINASLASAHNNLGLALQQKGRAGDAIAEFNEALRLQPDYADARANLSRAEELQRSSNDGSPTPAATSTP